MSHSLNNRIKYAMIQSGIQQKDLAEDMGFELPKGQARISQQLRGTDTDSIKLVEAVAKLTGANLLWLITGNGKEFDERTGFAALTEIPDDPEEYVSTRLRAMEESIKNLQDKINSIGGVEPTPADHENDAQEWKKNNLLNVAEYLLQNPDIKAEFLDALQVLQKGGIIGVIEKTKGKPTLTSTGRTIKRPE